jgi:hypothetical protein
MYYKCFAIVVYYCKLSFSLLLTLRLLFVIPAKASLCKFSSFIEEATVNTIINYDRKSFIVQVPGANVIKPFTAVSYDVS